MKIIILLLGFMFINAQISEVDNIDKIISKIKENYQKEQYQDALNAIEELQKYVAIKLLTKKAKGNVDILDVTPEEVAINPSKFKGSLVKWKGEIHEKGECGEYISYLIEEKQENCIWIELDVKGKDVIVGFTSEYGKTIASFKKWEDAIITGIVCGTKDNEIYLRGIIIERPSVYSPKKKK